MQVNMFEQDHVYVVTVFDNRNPESERFFVQLNGHGGWFNCGEPVEMKGFLVNTLLEATTEKPIKRKTPEGRTKVVGFREEPRYSVTPIRDITQKQEMKMGVAPTAGGVLLNKKNAANPGDEALATNIPSTYDDAIPKQVLEAAEKAKEEKAEAKKTTSRRRSASKGGV